MNKVIVFGGFGFLGYYLIKELLERNYEVTVADVSRSKDLELEVNYIYCDISNKQNVLDAFKQDRFNYVYNLAGFANLDKAIENPIKTIELNVVSNMYIVESCIKSNITNYFYASSAYALSNKGSFYGISKLASEKIIEEYHKKHNLPFVILRYGSVYSERDYENNYVYNLVKEAVLKKKINHCGDGNEIREYIHASDAAKLSVDVLETDKYNNTHVILTGNERMYRKELFYMINEILNNTVDITMNNNGYGNHYKFSPYSFEPSVSKKLIANPHIDMGQGLLECIRAVHYNEK